MFPRREVRKKRTLMDVSMRRGEKEGRAFFFDEERKGKRTPVDIDRARQEGPVREIKKKGMGRKKEKIAYSKAKEGKK